MRLAPFLLFLAACNAAPPPAPAPRPLLPAGRPAEMLLTPEAWRDLDDGTVAVPAADLDALLYTLILWKRWAETLEDAYDDPVPASVPTSRGE